MTQIKIVFLFAPLNIMSEEDQMLAKKIVAEEYCRQFACPEGEVEVTLCEGRSASNAYDIALQFCSEEKHLNEGSLRSAVKRQVANRYMLLLPRSSGFKGRITTMDGVYEQPKPEPLPFAEKHNTDEGPGEYKKRAEAYQAVEPIYSYDMLVIDSETRRAIEQAVGRIQYEQEVFQEWGLYAIMPHPISAMSFFGPPGTGKTMAADAVAYHLGKKIIHASYADIESKYHGEGPKNVSALFFAAEQQDAVLFIDEADSLLSKRLTNVTQGSEQAINSMRSQLLICLEQFHGIVIFATNLVVNYDKAFLSRLISVEFPFPDEKSRAMIWRNHLRPVEGARVKLNIPLAADVSEEELGKEFELCGREIRNAVVSACVESRMNGITLVTQEMLRRTAEEEIKRRENVVNAEDHTKIADKSVKSIIAQTIEKKLKNTDPIPIESVSE